MVYFYELTMSSDPLKLQGLERASLPIGDRCSLDLTVLRLALVLAQAELA